MQVEEDSPQAYYPPKSQGFFFIFPSPAHICLLDQVTYVTERCENSLLLLLFLPVQFFICQQILSSKVLSLILWITRPFLMVSNSHGATLLSYV